MKDAARAWGPAAAIAIAAVVWDPRAPAADAKRVLALLVAVIALAAGVARSKGARAVARPVTAFVAFVAWSGVTLAWGVPSGARDLGAWVAAAGIALAVASLPIAEARVLAERAALLAGSAAGAVALAQRLAGARGIFVHGGQGNANWLGLLLALTLPQAIWLALDVSRKPALRVAGFVASCLQLAGLALSHSRVAWGAAAIAIGMLVIAFARALPTRPRAATLASALVLALPIAVVTLRGGTPLPAPPKQAAAAIAEGADVPAAIAWSGRVWIWRSSLDAAASALPLGAGLGGFGHAYLDAQGKRLAGLDPKVASRRFLNATTAHSDWIEVLVDSGVVAVALLAVAVGWALLGAARERWLGGAGSIIAFAVCAAGDSPLRQPGIAVLLALVVAASAAASRSPARFELPPRLVPASRLGLLAAAALLLAGATGGWLAARRLTAAKEALPDDRAPLLASAARLDPKSGEIALETGLLELESGDAEGALGSLRRSRPLLANAGTDVAIGNALVLLERHEAALAAYEAALVRHPGSFRAHANIPSPLIALGRLDEAARHLAVASSLWPGHPRLPDMTERLRRARIDKETGQGVDGPLP